LGVAVLQSVISAKWFAAPAMTFDATGGNRILALNGATLDDAPARAFQRRIDMLGSRLGFVHGAVIFCLPSPLPRGRANSRRAPPGFWPRERWRPPGRAA